MIEVPLPPTYRPDALLELELMESHGPLCWLTAYQGIVVVASMEDSHILNCIAMFEDGRLERRGAYLIDGTCFAMWGRSEWVAAFEEELSRRMGV